jgi:hypothetical protein
MLSQDLKESKLLGSCGHPVMMHDPMVLTQHEWTQQLMKLSERLVVERLVHKFKPALRMKLKVSGDDLLVVMVW